MSKHIERCTVPVGEHVQSVRGSGMSTAIALAILATAVANPGERVLIEDHFGTQASHRELASKVKLMRGALGLGVVVELGDSGNYYCTADRRGVTEAKYVSR
jgi:hypothetical protein